ncbi:hypothetical protein [Priestia megaterium]|uniref:hypothetical protein n=1 Tax=Priestia megaterium TaxID=1404 RepID=UPI001F353FE0|nr:hypothetical protein [Priestia megaterium]MCF8890941.1 hypothetical protein [Priestia megaterium]
MKFARKSDELERHQTNKSLKIVFSFYSLSLLLWSIYSYVRFETMGFQFGILCIGQVIFFCSLFIQKNNVQKLEKD